MILEGGGLEVGIIMIVSYAVFMMYFSYEPYWGGYGSIGIYRM